MEKTTPHYSLAHLKQLISNKQLVIGKSPTHEFKYYGLTRQDIITLLLNLNPTDYHKSQTIYEIEPITARQQWRDVYRPVLSIEQLDMPDQRNYQELIQQGYQADFWKPKARTHVRFYIMLMCLGNRVVLQHFEFLNTYNRATVNLISQ